MVMTRKLFEMEEGKCDYCNEELQKNYNGGISRHKVKGIIVCGRCYRRYRRSGSMERKRIRGLSEEQKQNMIKERHKHRKEQIRRKTEELKKMAPEDLIALVKAESEAERIK